MTIATEGWLISLVMQIFGVSFASVIYHAYIDCVARLIGPEEEEGASGYTFRCKRAKAVESAFHALPASSLITGAVGTLHLINRLVIRPGLKSKKVCHV